MGAAVAGDDGATAVEFSLIATLLFMLLFGILQFGLTYNRQQGLHAAAREGARLASLGSTVTDSDVIDRVHEAAPAFITDPAADLVVEIDGVDGGDDTSCSSGQDTVAVAVSLTSSAGDKYKVQIPGVSSFTPDLSVEATFMCETERTSP